MKKKNQLILQKLLAPAAQEQEKQEIPQPHEDLLEVLVFQLANERFGIPIQNVVEIIRHTEATQVPHTVHFLEGIISFRGEMIPVLNGRRRLGHEAKDPDQKTRIVILQEGNDRYGIVVDATHQVLRLPRNNVEPAPPVVAMESAFIEGVYHHRGKLVILLNLNRFLEFT